ncbi:MAG: type II toxin-antitoxin system RelE/ParE family toxin [Truepera sp.]|nr:type II toxin-antitoxin system RelE/ParE family toxin [Truepera sp.]
MDIAFRTRKLKKIFNSEKELKKVYGNLAPTIQLRLAVLKNAPTLSAVPTTRPERRHQLRGKLRGQYAVDIDPRYRLVFKPSHDPVPRREDGGIDTDSVTAITIREITDYH